MKAGIPTEKHDIGGFYDNEELTRNQEASIFKEDAWDFPFLPKITRLVSLLERGLLHRTLETLIYFTTNN